MNQHHLILGGVKSGKTAFGERLALKLDEKPVYLATGRAWDGEMQQRIAAHQKARAGQFITIEEPLDLVEALSHHRNGTKVFLIDCLTLWITNLMMAERPVLAEVEKLTDWLLANRDINVIIVSNEVGQGVIPPNKMAREFVDYAGISHQKIAAVCHEVSFVTAGITQKLKG